MAAQTLVLGRPHGLNDDSANDGATVEAGSSIATLSWENTIRSTAWLKHRLHHNGIDVEELKGHFRAISIMVSCYSSTCKALN